MSEPGPLISERLLLRLGQLVAAVFLLIVIALGAPVVWVVVRRGWASAETASWVQASGSVAALFTAIGVAVVSSLYRFVSNTRVALAVCETSVYRLRQTYALAVAEDGNQADFSFSLQALSRTALALDKLPYVPISRFITAAIDLATTLDVAQKSCAEPPGGAPNVHAPVLAEQLRRAESALTAIRREFWWFRHPISLFR